VLALLGFRIYLNKQVKEYIDTFNAIVKANCGTIQTLILIELVDSDYQIIKEYILDTSANGLFSESGIESPATGLEQTKNGTPGEAGWGVVTYENDSEIFFINGYDYYGNSVFEKPRIARR